MIQFHIIIFIALRIYNNAIKKRMDFFKKLANEEVVEEEIVNLKKVKNFENQ